ncbi:UNVERIFIED_CONTAM: hypothetical protein K2H54_001177 [Gekko kuhli]
MFRGSFHQNTRSSRAKSRGSSNKADGAIEPPLWQEKDVRDERESHLRGSVVECSPGSERSILPRPWVGLAPQASLNNSSFAAVLQLHYLLLLQKAGLKRTKGYDPAENNKY